MNGQSQLSQVALLWAGLLIGCSFIATPAKFRAPSLSRSTALEVGRATFRAMVVAEVVLALVAVFIVVRSHQPSLLLGLAVLALATQWILIMPALNKRTDAVQKDGEAHGPPWHFAYIFLEAFKVVILLVVAFNL